MRSLWLLCVVVSAAYAAQVANPVYRAQPTIMMAKSANSNLNNPLNSNQPAAAPVQAEAEERESQAFPNSDNAKAVNSVVSPGLTSATHSILPSNTVVQPATLMQPASLVQTSSVLQPTSSFAADPQQQYQVYMMNAAAKPLTTPVNPYTAYTQQAYDGQYNPNPLQYQGQQVTAPSDGLLNNIPWKDVLVALSSLALLGLGASLAYPALKGLRSRALRELQDIKADDAARMAKSVMKAIRRFSEINQHD